MLLLVMARDQGSEKLETSLVPSGTFCETPSKGENILQRRLMAV